MRVNRQPESSQAAPRVASLRRDVLAAYTAAGSRIAGWAIVSSIVYRRAGSADFATLALIRGTIGILNYTAVGLAPALIRFFALSPRGVDSPAVEFTGSRPALVDGPAGERELFSTGIFVALASVVLGLGITAIYAGLFGRVNIVPPRLATAAPLAVMLIGVGTLLRLFSDTAGALLQTRGKIALDNHLLAASDVLWAIATAAMFRQAGFVMASATYAGAGLFLVVARLLAVRRLDGGPWPPVFRSVRPDIARKLLAFGSVILVAQLAEYFYAPTDYILINHFFSAAEVAAYAPGVQIDMALLMLVGALASVLLPRSAIAHAAGQPDRIARYYVRGTLISAALLSAAAAGVWWLYPLIFHLWFGTHPPNTRAILDLVLVGTVVGGSSAVGRSVLIGMGRVKPFTIAALLAGAVNVLASYAFVKYGHAGLRGILYGTLIAVIGRCGIWMPWYVLGVLRDEKNRSGNAPQRGR